MKMNKNATKHKTTATTKHARTHTHTTQKQNANKKTTEHTYV